MRPNSAGRTLRGGSGPTTAVATRAPSIHNSQPWRWRVGTQSLHLYADPDRRLPNTDPDSRDLLLRHKTTARGAYDRALAGIADDPRCFDVVFLNHRGEVAEGARSNVFVERDGVLVTPPVASGALPGVLRAELLAAGLAREAQLLPVDLEAGFFLGNALRGLIPVRLAQ